MQAPLPLVGPIVPDCTLDHAGRGHRGRLLERALGLLPPALQGTDARIIGTEHDEITLETRQAEAQATATQSATVTRQARHTDLTRVPVEVEVVMAQDGTKTHAPALGGAPRRLDRASRASAEACPPPLANCREATERGLRAAASR